MGDKNSNIKKYIIEVKPKHQCTPPEKNPKILYIPSGYAHGTQNLKKNTYFLVYSNFSIDESLKDDFRYPYDYWDKWKINFR